jgi:hypothetical protein
MKITIPNIEVVVDPLSGQKATINLTINSKITINGDMVKDTNDNSVQYNRDIITSEIYDANGVDITKNFEYYSELKVTESPQYTAAKTTFLNEVKNTYIAFLSQFPAIDINNVTIEL